MATTSTASLGWARPALKLAASSLAVLVGMAVLPLGATVEAQAPEPARIIVVPDTQNYANGADRSEMVVDFFAWIADQALSTNTAFVSHVGDVVDHPTSHTEWDRIEPAFALLDVIGLPYAIAPGNHDLQWGGDPVPYDDRFAASRFAGADWFGGSHEAEGNRSNFQRISIPGHELLMIHVRHLKDAYGDIGPVLDWVDQVLTDHPDHLAIITTHQFTYDDASIRIPELADLVAEHCTVALVLSGHHYGGAAHGSFDDACGRPVHHLLTNYQAFPNGGDGFLRTLDIDPLTLNVQSQVYSPILDEYRTGPAERLSFDLAPLPIVGGDVNCDREVDIADALAIAQMAAVLRTGRQGCPLADPGGHLNLGGGDVSGDGRVDILDALMIARCLVGLSSNFCPDG